jgi:hypothetical protein
VPKHTRERPLKSAIRNLTAGPDHGGEFVGDDLDGAGPGGGFDPLEQHAKIGFRTIKIAHVVN